MNKFFVFAVISFLLFDFSNAQNQFKNNFAEFDGVTKYDNIQHSYNTNSNNMESEFTTDVYTVGLWHLNESSGDTAFDASDNYNYGEIIGNSNWTDNGYFNNAFYFDGDTYIEIPDNESLDITDQLTLEAWIYFEVGGTDNPRIVAKQGYSWIHSDNSYGLWTEMLPDTNERLVAFSITTDDIENHLLLSKTKIYKKTWYHVAGVYDGNFMKIFINGKLDTSMAVTGKINKTSIPVTIGRKYSPYDYFKGMIDEVRISNIARYDSSKYVQFTRITSGDIVNDSIITGGCTWVDYNNDGFLDLFVVGDDENYLYKNNGNGAFSKIRDDSFLKHEGISSVGSAWVDYDNDGDLDVYIGTLKENANYLYKNNSDGSFNLITDRIIGTDIFPNVGGISWGDYNNDGMIDLFVGTYDYFSSYPSHLYYSDGNDGFYQAPDSVLVNDNRKVFGSVAADFDNDGDLDIFISNQTDKNRLYINKGTGEFEKFTQDSIFSDYDWTTGASWGDYDNDGDFDLFVCNGSGNHDVDNNLYQNNGDGTFSKINDVILVNDRGYSYVPIWIDYDNDGWLDLFVINRKATAPFLYHNNGDRTFTKITDEIFLDNDSLDYDAACWGDYDNDGFLDLFISTWHSKNRLYRNLGNGNNWFKIKLVGIESNRSGIGAKIRVKSTINGKSIWQLRQIASQASFRSQNDLIAHFGLGDAQIIDSLKIEWPSGAVDHYANIAPNQFIIATENIGITDIEGQHKYEIPNIFTLYQNYPNPFNPKTNIAFDLPKSSHVKIEVYNIQGELIKTLLNKYLTAGSHVIRFNASNLASGIYFYKIKAGNFIKVKKMIIVK